MFRTYCHGSSVLQRTASWTYAAVPQLLLLVIPDVMPLKLKSINPTIKGEGERGGVCPFSIHPLCLHALMPCWLTVLLGKTSSLQESHVYACLVAL